MSLAPGRSAHSTSVSRSTKLGEADLCGGRVAVMLESSGTSQGRSGPTGSCPVSGAAAWARSTARSDTRLGREVAIKVLLPSCRERSGAHRTVPPRSPRGRLAQPSEHRRHLRVRGRRREPLPRHGAGRRPLARGSAEGRPAADRRRLWASWSRSPGASRPPMTQASFTGT